VHVPRNHADCSGNDCGIVQSGEIRHIPSLLVQFGLTPGSKRGQAASDPGAAVAPLDTLWRTTWNWSRFRGRQVILSWPQT